MKISNQICFVTYTANAALNHVLNILPCQTTLLLEYVEVYR